MPHRLKVLEFVLVANCRQFSNNSCMMRWPVFLTALLYQNNGITMRDFHFPGRSPAHSTMGMVATSNPLASSTGIGILKEGGNAIDAAVAAAAVLGVVEPFQTGIGGDCFALLALAGNKLIGYNGSGKSPKGARFDWYLDNQFNEIPSDSAHAVTIPGALEAWSTLIRDYGTMSLEDVLQPAIGYAKNGFPVHSRASVDWRRSEELLKKNLEASSIFLPGGEPPSVGQVFFQKDLAKTLQLIAKKGPETFYTDWIAEKMVHCLRELGGHHTVEDFSDHKGCYVTPISTTYRGYEVFQIPPNNQGITALLLLNILEQFSLLDMDPMGPERLHLEIEAARLAYADRDALIGDVSADSLINELLSKDYAKDRSRLIDLGSAGKGSHPGAPHGSDTVYLCVVDKDRNAVSLISSIFHTFGSGVVVPSTGVLLQNRGAGFRLKDGHPNCIGPSKRPLHTIMPGMVYKADTMVMPMGVMGGDYQPTGNAHVLSNIIDFGCDIQEALDLPRIFYEKGIVQVERGIAANVQNSLTSRGHNLEQVVEALGGGHGIWVDNESGVMTAGTDPRLDGCAIGY